MEIFKGWYRKSFTKGRWHRINRVDSVLGHRKMGITICGQKIPAIICDYNSHPDSTSKQPKCVICKRSEDEDNYTLQRQKTFALFNLHPMTKGLAIHHLRKLISPREYLVKIHDIYGIIIEAKWTSDTSIDITTTNIVISDKIQKRQLKTMQQVKKDLDLFGSSIDYLIAEINGLAHRNTKKNKLTEYEEQEYFEELLEIAEKTR